MDIIREMRARAEVMQEEWTIAGIERQFLEHDLPACRTATERLCAEVFHGREVRHMASNLTRKLTPGERAIAEKYGWRE